ncbi:MAG: hypothetical protein M3Q03_18205 [Chloroflexota bacterium]|nr:hypothetical protein [Chloroflexota bacterium]
MSAALARRHPPFTIAFDPTGIPVDLTARRQWVCWRWEWREDRQQPEKSKWTKIPVDPLTGRNASTKNSATWGSFDDAVRCCEQRSDIAGVGFVFTDADPFVGIDQDKVRNSDTDDITPEAAALVNRLDSYTEPSVSGTGLHTIVRGKLPRERRRRDQIEVYETGRFFAFTGRPLPGHTEIADRHDVLAAWHREMFPPKSAPSRRRTPSAVGKLPLDDETVLAAVRSRPEVVQLYDHGDLTAYGGDDSGGDLALCNYLVSSGARDADQVDRLFRGSALMRDKWDVINHADGRTYGQGTVDKALEDVVPAVSSFRLTPAPDPEMTCEAHVGALEARVAELEAQLAVAEARGDKLSKLQSLESRILANKGLGQARLTGVALSRFFACQEARDGAPITKPVPVLLGALGDLAGVSADAVGDHIKDLVKAGLVRKESRLVPGYLDPETGEMVPTKREVSLAPTAGSAVRFAEALASYQPTDVNCSKWGGVRVPRCPAHPNAEVIRTTRHECGECGAVLREERERAEPATLPVEEDQANTPTETVAVGAVVVNPDASVPDAKDKGVKPQDAPTTSKSTGVVWGQDAGSPPPPEASPPVTSWVGRVKAAGEPGWDRWTRL